MIRLLKNCKGFSLLEFVIYLLLFSIIATGGAYWLSAAWQIITNGSHASRSINLHIAHDLLVRDIHSALAQKSDWKKIAEDEIIWRVSKHDIGWHHKEGQLVRLEGIYDQKSGQWNKKAHSIIARSVAQVRFQVHGQHEVKKVSFEFVSEGSKEYCVANVVTVCNGSVL